MLQKNIDKQKRKLRVTWTGYYPRKTPTKKTMVERNDKKHKNKQILPHANGWDFIYHYSGGFTC